MVADSDGHQASMSYDATGRLASVTAPNSETIGFVYDAGGRLVETRLNSGQRTTQTWFEDGSLKQRQNLFNTTVLSSYLYRLDQQGRRAGQTEIIGGVTKNWSYLYDNLDRLTSASDGTAETYGYDIFGNRRSKTKGATTTAYLYDDAHQLSEVRSGSDAGALIGAAVHDADGHMVKLCEVGIGGTVTNPAGDCTASGTGATTLALVWNALDHLNTATRTGVGAVAESYVYDDSGRRISKTSAATTTSYLYDGDDIHAEWNGSISGMPAAAYVHGANIDEPLLRLTGATNGPGATQAAYIQDGLGSIVGTANVTGTLTANQRFDAWGNKLSSSGTIPQYGYTGREPDATGLEFYRNRYYHPGLGRFASRDPMGMADSVSPYAYVANSPVNLIDPMGLRAWDPVIVAGGNSCYYSGNCTMTDAQEEGYDFSNGPVNVAGGVRNGGGGSRNRNYRPEPTIQNLASMAQVRNIEEQIQRYNPSYRYSEVSASGYSQDSVASVRADLGREQAQFQSRVYELRDQLPEGRARDSHTTLALTRAVDPSSGATVDILTLNARANPSMQSAAAQIARTNGYQFARGFGDQHAEVVGQNAAAAKGLVNPVTASSRPMCPGCVANSLATDTLMGTAPQRPFSFIPK